MCINKQLFDENRYPRGKKFLSFFIKKSNFNTPNVLCDDKRNLICKMKFNDFLFPCTILKAHLKVENCY